MRIHTIGGFSEVGKNMTAVELKDDVIIFDCGVFLPPIVALEEQERTPTEQSLRKIKAVPDDLMLDKLGLRKKVRAIIPSHAHLDHIGAIPYLAYRYNAEIIGTPFTIEVLKSIIRDERLRFRTKIKVVQPNSSYFIQGKNKKYQLDFVNITHSTLQTSMLALHTDEGIILYSNDFKFDDNPIVGKKPNYEKLKELSKKGIKVLIVDSLYSGDDRKTPSEKVARSLLEDVMLSVHNHNAAMVVTTFSSHIARLKSIVDFGKKLKRRVVFVGRSLNKYVSAAKNIRICPFAKDIQLTSYRNQVAKVLKQVDKNRGNYLLVCTGHQGEPGSILDRLSRNQLPFNFKNQDNVIFSSSVIPTSVNIENRNKLDKRLKQKNIRIFNNVHVSGHAGREDLRDFINLVKPQHIIPAHGEQEKLKPMIELAQELGYKYKKNVHLMSDGQTLKI